MTEYEAMAILVSAVPAYGRREMALRASGGALQILGAPAAYAAQLGEAGVKALREMLRSGEGERMLERLARSDTHLVLRAQEGYPARLLEGANPPHLLFVKGRAALDDPIPLAIVGTRSCTAYGRDNTHDIAMALARAGVCVISGLATGIDASSHRGALHAGGRTIAVLGSALDKMYPRENLPLMREIIAGGGSVVSEYAPGVSASRYSFLHRNRIIAGMSLGVLVTEGAKRSGALNTAQHALDAGREVFALPGSVQSPTSALPHMLIAEGARLITCAQDILDTLRVEPASPDGAREKAKKRAKSAMVSGGPIGAAPPAIKEDEKKKSGPPPHLGEAEKRIWQALCAGETDFDALCISTGIDAQELGAMLMMMEMDGVIRALPGLLYALA